MEHPGGVAERSNAPVLKTGVRSRGPRVRIPPPPLHTIRIWLYSALRGLLSGPRAAGTEVNVGQPETASAGAFFPRAFPGAPVVAPCVGRLWPALLPSPSAEPRGSVKSSPTGPSAASREAVPLTGSRGGASRTRRSTQRLAVRRFGREKHYARSALPALTSSRSVVERHRSQGSSARCGHGAPPLGCALDRGFRWWLSLCSRGVPRATAGRSALRVPESSV
jgi:hypothetical protein